MTEPVFGYHAVESLLRHDPGRIQLIYLQAERADRRMMGLSELAENQGVAIRRVPRAELDDLVSGRHQGVVAIVSGQPSASAEGLDESALMALVERTERPLLLILDGVTDPHNLGACLRSADGAGVTAVIFPKDKNADMTAVARKVASGAADTTPWVRVSNLARTMEALKARGVWMIGTAGDAAQSLYQQDFTGSCAIVMGSEGAGLRRLTRDLCDFLVSLPMAGSVSSLNVSVAAGVCLFEAVRQRGKKSAV